MKSLKRFALQVILFIICSRCIIQMICICIVILFSCMNNILTCIKNRSLFNLPMNTLNEIELELYCSHVMVYCLYCFYALHLCS